ncbi:subtilisin-like protein [Wolfiporia cocos MD-104 SS10]|uniref:Subtilisin-like protein n=1 Tax=Wolfiporia cocos (strain MD-104) TaxID=742152 RepID=A0A2H3JIC8_WOLCO|nr:subtilisin-like protein [Wolfiporia cocos MD-104 SS10]
MTPACLQNLYNIPSASAISDGIRIAVPGYIDRWANQADLQTIDGGTNNQNASEAAPEPDLDTQYTVGLATGIPVTFVSVGGTTPEFYQSLFDTAHFLLNETSPPQVMTTSYADYEYLAPPALAYVTSVGGTVGLPQMAANFSTGGFSNLWGRPDYQASAVDAYLTLLGNNDTGLYNASGRAYPDVSIYAVDFEIIVDGQPIAITGTSCASPTFASIIALLNDQLVAAGRPVMGFLNPFLYSQGLSALTDITEGNNLACSNGTTGFYATVGWDPVTGLGTPDFLRLKAAVGL